MPHDLSRLGLNPYMDNKYWTGHICGVPVTVSYSTHSCGTYTDVWLNRTRLAYGSELTADEVTQLLAEYTESRLQEVAELYETWRERYAAIRQRFPTIVGDGNM